MNELISLSKNPSEPDDIVRSKKDGPEYNPHWRFRVAEKYLIRIARAQDPATTRREICSEEKDSFLRKFLAFQLDGRSSKSGPIEYALRCYRSRKENLTATTISAMVIAGRSARDIAQEIGTTRANVAAYERIFFDVRRYLQQRPWIKELCYFPSRITVLEEGASRWLITAFERGWNGLAFIFSTSRSEPKAADRWNLNPVGKSISDMISLGLGGRAADFVNFLEMSGVKPTAQDVELLVGLVGSGLPASFHQLDYPKALSRKEEKISRKAHEVVDSLTAAGRRRVTVLLEGLILNKPTQDQQVPDDPKPGEGDQSKPSEAPMSASENTG